MLLWQHCQYQDYPQNIQLMLYFHVNIPSEPLATFLLHMKIYEQCKSLLNTLNSVTKHVRLDGVFMQYFEDEIEFF